MKVHAPFRFKKFSVAHHRSAMKVGTDAVLLGAWVNVGEAHRILDVGTGCGIIALMLAQRSDASFIDAIDVQKEDATEANENCKRSPWAARLCVTENSLQEFNPGYSYDLIVSNPPYFSKSLLPPSAHRTRTRHTHQLSFEELIFHARRLLRESGRLAVVLPYSEGLDFKSLAHQKGFHLARQLAFFSRKEKPQERWLFEFVLAAEPLREETLTLYSDGDTKSEEYIRLTRDFYLT
ncbi:MAG: methyltransferase [Bacteroidetes bacterium]|nr:methyltransferase [Bacteroidota bacterium]